MSLLQCKTYSESEKIKTTPVALKTGDSLETVSFIEIRYKKYKVSHRKYEHKYIVYYDVIRTQQVSIFESQQSVLANPWYSEQLAASSVPNFAIAPMVMPIIDPEDLSTQRRTNATNQNVEIQIKARKFGRKKSKTRSFQEYVQ